MPLLAQIPVIGGRTLKLPVKTSVPAGWPSWITTRNSTSPWVWLKQCTFELDDVGTVVTNLKVRRISEHSRTRDNTGTGGGLRI